MRLNFFRTIGLLLVAGLLMPAGMLLASETQGVPAVTSSTTNWYNVEQASNLFKQMNALALKARREVGRLQVQGYEMDWRAQASRLEGAKTDINTIANDLMQLNEMKNKLEPWQKSLLNKVTPNLHEMVYQMDAALGRINAHQNRTYLSMTQYPQNINQIYKNANQMSNTIGTVTQYAQAEQKMAALDKMHSTKAGS